MYHSKRAIIDPSFRLRAEDGLHVTLNCGLGSSVNYQGPGLVLLRNPIALCPPLDTFTCNFEYDCRMVYAVVICFVLLYTPCFVMVILCPLQLQGVASLKFLV